MAEFDEERNQLRIKLVYYGPALSGKTTNLAALHDLLQPDLKGDMMVLETRNDRTLFFDLFPLGFELPSGLTVTFKLYTVPGQVEHDSTRKAVLSRADGVAFIADSQRTQEQNNLESFRNLSENANRVGLDFGSLPLAVQFNKRDLGDIVSKPDLVARWQSSPWWPIKLATALESKGVLETFQLLLERTWLALDREYALGEHHGLDSAAFVRNALGQNHVAS
ncbi:GTP-binding protein [Vreelandella utahensis]|uniref:GTP-binding protein n=1 Tax=Vreelandella halophila TaxID=86177 RepID=UPI0009875408|nr:GTPase domain-containing protein [Halomonas utahensis]